MTEIGQEVGSAVRYRFVVLVIFSLNAVLSRSGCLQFSSVSDATMYFYGVKAETVDWTSMVYSVSNVVFLFPAAWVFEKKGFRFCSILCSLFSVVGNTIKCFSFEEDRFYLVILGQIICGASQTFLFLAPSRLANDWFPSKDVSKASAVAVMALQFGIAGSFLMTTLAISDVKDKIILRHDFQMLQYGLTGAAILLLIVTVIGMRDKPKSPPSVAASLRASQGNKQTNYLTSIRNITKNKNFIIHWFAYGLCISTYFGLLTVVTQVLQTGFSEYSTELFGWIGFLMCAIGLPCGFLCGAVLDRFRCYKELTLILYVSTTLSCVLLGVMNRLVDDPHFMFLPSALIGISFTCYTSVGFEIGTEITYPESESTMGGLLYTLVQLINIICLTISSNISQLWPNYTDICLVAFYVGILSIGSVLTVFIQRDYKRQKAENSREGF